MSTRAFLMAVSGFAISVAACSTYGTSVVDVSKTPAKVASVSVTVPQSLIAGQRALARAVPKDANGTPLTDRAVTWSTSSQSIASVSDSGMISAIAPGTAVVSATSEGIAGQATMAVTPPPPNPVATVSVALSPSSVLVGQTAHATATLLDSNGAPLTGRTITWESDNAGVATVAATGDVTAVSAGTANIKATSEGKSNSAALTVTAQAPVAVASVSVSPTGPSVQVGATVQLSAVTRDANNNVLTGRTITWSSANTGVATVSASGLVKGVSAGTVSVTASSEGQSGSTNVTVTAPPPPPPPAPVASVSVSPSSTTIQVGATVQLSATTRDANNNVLTGRVISWSSANAAVASVNSTTGLVTAVAAGTVQITATSEGQTGNSTITVTTPPPPPPPPPPGSYNEPTGMTLISQRPFSSLQEDPKWDTDNSLTIEQDPTAPYSPQGVLRCTFRAGFVAGNSNGHAGTQFSTSYKTLYIRYWTKYSSNWQGQQTFSKQLYAWVDANGGYTPIFFGALGEGTTSPLTPEPVLQRTIVGDGFKDPNLVPNAVFTRGQWDMVEIILVGNTAGNTDGSVDWYLNGVHIGSVKGIQWATGDAKWFIFEYYPVWGGQGGPNVQQDMWIQWDHVYLSGKN